MCPLFFHQMIALQKLWKMLFVSSKKLFSFMRYSNFCISVLPSFSPCGHCFRGLSKINLKVYNVITYANKNLIKHFVWYLQMENRYDNETLLIDTVSNREHFYGKSCRKYAWKASPDPFPILVNNPKQQLHVRNSFENKIFWKRIIKKP